MSNNKEITIPWGIRLEEFFDKHYNTILILSCGAIHAAEAIMTGVAFANVITIQGVSGGLLLAIAVILFMLIAFVQFSSALRIPKYITLLSKDREDTGYEATQLILNIALYLGILWAFTHINLMFDGMISIKESIPFFIEWLGYRLDHKLVEGIINPSSAQWKAGIVSLFFLAVNFILELTASVNGLTIGRKLKRVLEEEVEEDDEEENPENNRRKKTRQRREERNQEPEKEDDPLRRSPRRRKRKPK